MKKTSLVLGFIALSFSAISAQNCSKTAVKKAENTTIAVAKKGETAPVETPVIAMIDKPVVVAKMLEKAVEIVDSKPQNTVETTAQTANTTPVATEKAMEATLATPVQNATQVSDNKAINADKKIKTAAFDHSVWNDLLKKHVSATGKVNYKNFKGDLELLDTYMRSLNEGAPSETASKEERLAYWINAYNAVTVRLIIANYPLSSITKLDGGKPWDVKRYSNGGKKLSLNDIENNILRPMGDARIHFALNCAAKSCPPILNEAFTAENVNKLLEQRTKQFINSSRTVIEKDEIKVSKIFDWYGKDFGNVVDFINKYAKTKAAKTAKVAYLDYDWNLND